MIEFFLEGEYTHLNDYIKAERGNRFAAAKIKETETIRAKLGAVGVPAVKKYPVAITFLWIRKDKRVDPDNIEFATKFILDGLVKAGVLKDDGADEISSISHAHAIDKASPGVYVHIGTDNAWILQFVRQHIR